VHADQSVVAGSLGNKDGPKGLVSKSLVAKGQRFYIVIFSDGDTWLDKGHLSAVVALEDVTLSGEFGAKGRFKWLI
jgi:hypothetical protein